MNENPEGTPNPLNPNPVPEPEPTPTTPDLAPEPQPMPEPMPTDPIIESMAEPEEKPMSSSEAPMMNPTEESANNMVQTPKQTTEDNTSTSEAEPKEKKKSQKKMWIIIAVVAVLVAIGCAVAAIAIINPFQKEDVVSNAITRLLNGETPKNVAMSGVVNFVTDDEDSEITALKLDLDSQIASAYKTGSVSATLTVAFKDESELSFNVEEVTVADGDLYLQIDGLSESLNDLYFSETTCEDDATNCEILDMPTEGVNEFAILAQLFDVVEGQWIRIPADYLDAESSTDIVADESVQCLVGVLSNIGQYSNSLVEIYNQNQFIVSSTEDVKIAQKENPIYRLNFDEEQLSNFADALTNTTFANDIASCINNGSEEGSAEIGEIFASYPTIYVEIDDSYNFTRFYLDATTADGMSTITTDFSFSYPNTIEIVEPAEYTDIDTLLMGLFSGFTIDEAVVIE